MYVGSTFPEIKRQYIDTGKVYYVYKDFPILSNHPQAGLAAQAAECAGDQDAFWPMHDALFAEPSEWDSTPEAARAAFERYATTLGLDTAALNTCLDEGRHAAEVQADFAEARGLGLNGTPAFIINGKLLSGARPTEDFLRAIEQELADS